MTHQIQQVLQSHLKYGKRMLNILNVGGGKSSIAIHLVSELNWNVHAISSDKEVHVPVTPESLIWVVDINQVTIADGHYTITKLNLPV